MSGVYGIFSINPSSMNINNMLYCSKNWNSAYGSKQEDVIVNSSFAAGISHRHITNSPVVPNPILHHSNKYAFIDAIIYNRDELLSKYNLPSSFSDEEIIFNRFIAQKDFSHVSLADINGDFCGAVYCEKSNQLVLFRDHLGIRPLFYYISDSFVAFSTDIRGLIAIPEVTCKVNPEWLHNNICGYIDIFYSSTEFQDIFEVAPASCISFTCNLGNAINKTEYTFWHLGSHKYIHFSRKAYSKELNRLVTGSVAKRANVFPDPIGAELSGGLDSGVISILINRLNRQGIYYSWSYSPEVLPLVPNDERLVIQDICNQEKIKCDYGNSTIDLSPTSNIGLAHIKAGLSSDFTYDAGLNLALPPYINTHIICDSASTVKRGGGNVVFTGHGGDEGVSHRLDPFELLYNFEFIHFLSAIWHQTQSAENRIHKSLGLVKYYMQRLIKFSQTPFNTGRGASNILKGDFLKQFDSQKMPVLYFKANPIKYIYSGATKNRPKVAALLGEYSGARYVFPFLDYNVIDYAVSIPRYLYLNNQQNRAIYREAFKEIMPKSLYEVTSKFNASEAHLYDDGPDPDWHKRYMIFKNEIKDNLDREFWSDYLDFEEIDRWAASDEPSPEDRDDYLNEGSKLLVCYSLQHMIESVKVASEKNLSKHN